MVLVLEFLSAWFIIPQDTQHVRCILLYLMNVISNVCVSLLISLTAQIQSSVIISSMKAFVFEPCDPQSHPG